MVNINEVRCDLCNKIITRTQGTKSLFWGGFRGEESRYRIKIILRQEEKMEYDLCRGCYLKAIKQLKQIGMQLKQKEKKEKTLDKIQKFKTSYGAVSFKTRKKKRRAIISIKTKKRKKVRK